MKKQKLGLNKLNLAKSKIAELNSHNAKGGWNTASTNPDCLATGIYDGCEVTGNCNTANHCGNTNNGCQTNGCSNGCGNTQTREIISCYEAC
ncbi:hypothetical protein U8527_21710 [Kordia algicida OT-1]|uniref:Uncharacterized protein n=1 Tax=Kordia algicida OT-1 TaxID=391587 RepID=A9DQ73_9FLAO|nr:hypothetical protein [Kordia algicida]EDP96591.1 hypothetical protein KAOT1_15548 [Kordia algicida OT-1]